MLHVYECGTSAMARPLPQAPELKCDSGLHRRHRGYPRPAALDGPGTPVSQVRIRGYPTGHVGAFDLTGLSRLFHSLL